MTKQQDVREVMAGVAASGFPAHRTEWTAMIDSHLNALEQSDLQRQMLAGRNNIKSATAVSEGHRAVMLAELRSWMKNNDIDYFLLPNGDPQFSEMPPASSRYLEALTGFGGSFGVAVIGQEKAGFFTDKRYIKPASKLSPDYFSIAEGGKGEYPALMEKILDKIGATGGMVGFDAAQFTKEGYGGIEQYKPVFDAKGMGLKALPKNPLNKIWLSRPKPPLSPIMPFPIDLSGESTQSKLTRIREEMKNAGADALVTSSPGAIAWMFNVRAYDGYCTPSPRARALVTPNLAILFTDKAAITSDTTAILKRQKITTSTLKSFPFILGSFNNVMADPSTEPFDVFDSLKDATVLERPNPVEAMKLIKNPVQQEAIKEAHMQEGLAYSRFLFRVDQRLGANVSFDEWDAVQILESERQKNPDYWGQSFPTISSIGANGADIHRMVTPETASPMVKDTLYLVDAGAQMRGGTTDMTRVLATGKVDDDMKRAYTEVLKAHIALASAVFPQGTTDGQLHEIAVPHVTGEFGYGNFHGTGHGVSQFGGVHELPPTLRSGMTTEIKDGMFFSNEPGYYEAGKFGIRIENLFFAHKRDDGMLELEAVSCAPIDLRPVDLSKLTEQEIEWIDSYHATVAEKLMPRLEEHDHGFASWLAQRTASFAEQMRYFAAEKKAAANQNIRQEIALAL